MSNEKPDDEEEKKKPIPDKPSDVKRIEPLKKLIPWRPPDVKSVKYRPIKRRVTWWDRLLQFLHLVDEAVQSDKIEKLDEEEE